MEETMFNERDKPEEKIQIVMRQTDYSEDKAREKLIEFNFDEMSVIRNYFGVDVKNATKQIVSVNQEIYKQLRGHLDGAMLNYRQRTDKGDVK
jgi:uncharacterized lipoprotein YehR (DUF1307 family)